MAEPPLIASAQNPDGRTVELDSEAWNHVLEEHAEMARHMDATMMTIESPEYREPDLRAGRERYFRRGGPLTWLRVVTEFSGNVDRVVTAFPQSNDPRPAGQR